MRRARATALACWAGACLVPVTARADAVDFWSVFSRVGNWKESPVKAVVLLVVVLAVNYALNLVVLGLPARRLGFGLKRSAKDLIGFTLFAQVADRLGIVVGFAVATACAFLFKFKGENGLGEWFLAGIALNFVFCGIAVGFLAYHYLKRRWALPVTKSRWLALAAGVITNPSWIMVTWFGARH
jgi:hypothetical protein